MSRHLNRLILSFAFFLGMLIVILGEVPGQTMLWRAVQNSGHIFVFGVLSVIALFLVRTTGWVSPDRHVTAYLIAAIVSLFTGIFIEFIQLSSDRDADIHDVLRNAIGILSFLGLYANVDPALKEWRNNTAKGIIISILSVSLALLIAGLTPLMSLASDYYQRNIAFPALVEFNKRWSQTFITTRRTSLKIVALPDQWQEHDQRLVGQLTLFPAWYPGLTLNEPVSDWSAYTHLSFRIYAETAQPFKLTLRINDAQHNRQYEDRYNTSLTIRQGMNLFRIPLEEIRNGPVFRELDMQSIEKLTLFAVEPDQPIEFYLSNLHLE